MTSARLQPDIRLAEPQPQPAFRVEADGIVWVGPADPEVDKPWLQWRLALAGEPTLARALDEGDCLAIGAALAQMPVPLGVLQDLARYCQQKQPTQALAAATGAADTDLRWRQALAEACLAAGTGSEDIPVAIPQPIADMPADWHVTHLRRLPAHRLAVLSQPNHDTGRPAAARLTLIGDMSPHHTIAMAAPERVTFALPYPVGAATAGIAVSAYDHTQGQGTVWVFDTDGTLIGHGSGPLAMHPQAFSVAGGTVWLHGESAHVQWHLTRPSSADADQLAFPTAVTETALRRLPRAGGLIDRRFVTCGDWLLALPESTQGSTGRVFPNLVWVDLTGKHADRIVPWGQDIWRTEADGDRLWLASAAGLVSAGPDHAPLNHLAEPVYGLALTADVAYLGTRSGDQVICLERSTGATFWRTTIGHAAYTLYVVPGGVIAGSIDRWTWLSDEGEILMASDERRDVGFAVLADGTSAVSAGEDVLIIDPHGKPARRLMLPYDGCILGATARHFLYGAVDGGVDRITPDGLYAIAATGDIVATLPFQPPGSPLRLTRTTYGGGTTIDTGVIGETGVWLCPYPGQQLLFWDLPAESAPATQHLPTIPRLPTQRGVTEVRWNTVNPRDEWAEPGIAVARANLLAIDGTYGGTTGVSPGPAVLVSDGATATFQDCRFTAGGGQLQRHATVVLIGCELDETDWEIGDGCHLVLIDCNVPETTPFRLAPSATLTTPGVDQVPTYTSTVSLRGTGPAEKG